MDEGVEYSGRTVDDAIAEAEAQLGTNREELDIEVLSPGSRGVFGIGAEQARIRVTRREAVAAPSVSTQAAPPSEDRPPPGLAPAPAPAHEPDLVNQACTVLRELLQTMGFEAEVSVRSPENPLMLAINGRNLGVLIGRRGDNLAALQFMVNLILSKHRRQWPRIVIDVENYRARREETLRSLADRAAYQVQRNQRPFTLEAMPSGDRRIIHLALRDRPEVETYSIGEGAARRVVIAPTRKIRSAPGGHYS